MNTPTAQQLDAEDPLAAKRDDFLLPEQGVYLDGNSLGCLTRQARQRAREVVEQQWGQDLIKSWNSHGWIDLPTRCGEKIAPLIGAAPGQVICCDSISVNLFKIVSAALKLRAGRRTVLSTVSNFPTDLYTVQGLQALLGEQQCRLQLCADTELESALGDDVAVLLMSHVDFRTGYVNDMQHLTAMAHQLGALVIWDLAHSAGAMPVMLDDCRADFAVGCGYKYLNGGPGAPAFIYAAKRHQAGLQQPLSGWMGHRAPFDFDTHYAPAAGMQQFLSGTPAVLSMSVLEAALDVFRGIDLSVLRSKSLALTDLFIRQVRARPALADLQLISPIEHEYRGSQLAWRHPDAWAISQALIARGIIGDFRAPDIVRFGFSPLYLRYQDVERSVDVLEDIVCTGMYRQSQFQLRKKVT
ncbi:kynureninase [Pseudohongiella spirulinae]|uniref:Kynureninase n=1 Tax=Pseudohongiella spirulinae TaxID=1249552 RepID=A0A0S2KGB4_9GAMM|nr:kynureninase [Pseudohongiella spirulinae]ALO47355.1 kynureninase [Pseudohongiella spirulinae]